MREGDLEWERENLGRCPPQGLVRPNLSHHKAKVLALGWLSPFNKKARSLHGQSGTSPCDHAGGPSTQKRPVTTMPERRQPLWYSGRVNMSKPALGSSTIFLHPKFP